MPSPPRWSSLKPGRGKGVVRSWGTGRGRGGPMRGAGLQAGQALRVPGSRRTGCDLLLAPCLCVGQEDLSSQLVRVRRRCGRRCAPSPSPEPEMPCPGDLRAAESTSRGSATCGVRGGHGEPWPCRRARSPRCAALARSGAQPCPRPGPACPHCHLEWPLCPSQGAPPA